MFMKAVAALRAAGATVVFDDDILPPSFAQLARAVNTRPYVAEGTEHFLRDFGPPAYHSTAEYARAVGTFMSGTVFGGARPDAPTRLIETDPEAEATVWEPQRRAVAAYDDTLARFQLDGFVYPAIQMPPNDEIAELDAGQRSSGPHSNTGWHNQLGVPAISMPAGFYDNGLPFGLEMSARRWRDGDLVGWASSYEEWTHSRRPPVLIDRVQR
jgi:Asp-tRNA(Asn)/Glu-tRNA(Gln) amidotransferase A subunit family amidase